MSAELSPVDFGRLPPLFLVRHGETAWNAEGRLQGQTDTDMSPRGRAQADRNGARLKGLVAEPAEWDFVASPLQRTRETMERVRTAMDLAPDGYRTDPRLMELHFGGWQGSTYAELEAREPGATAPRHADKWGFVPPGEGGESYADLCRRIAPFLAGLRGPTVCVTHGGVIRAMFFLSGALSPEQAAAILVPQHRVLRVEGGRLDWL